MNIDWLSVLMGWLGGIPTGVLSNWLFHKLQNWRRAKNPYLTYKYENNTVTIEGQYPYDANMAEEARRLLSPTTDNGGQTTSS